MDNGKGLNLTSNTFKFFFHLGRIAIFGEFWNVQLVTLWWWLNWKFIVPLSISWRYLNFSNFPPKTVTGNLHTKFKLTVYRHAGNSIQETLCKEVFVKSNKVSKMIQWVVTITLWNVNAHWLLVYTMSINFSCLFTNGAKM